MTDDHVWFTGDHHFGHENIIKYAERPYINVAEMDEDLIEEWNSVVRRSDLVYYLGDFTLGGTSIAQQYFSRLSGDIEILNNFWHHDKRWINSHGQCTTKNGWIVLLGNSIKVLEIPELGKDGYPLAITLCHYPIGEWDRKHYGAWHLHGHSHNKYQAEGKILDVGVDSAIEWLGEYRPFSFSEVIEIMESKRE
jgi:calcineurin-like phosphoesterase family protein